MLLDSAYSRISKDCGENDRALNCFFPERIDSSEDQRGSDAAEQRCAKQSAYYASASSCNGNTANYDRCDCL
jgi:hypothetical protein